MSWNPTHGQVYSIQYYVIKCVCDLRQVEGFFGFFGFFHRFDITVIVMKVALNTITLTVYNSKYIKLA